jgi:hypothetical protein
MTEPQLSPSREGSVVLDIGGDVGALVLRVPAMLNGYEIDIQPDDLTMPRTHSAVRRRVLADGIVYVAVYPSLKEGTYTVVDSGQTFTITGGTITHVEFHSADETTDATSTKTMPATERKEIKYG